MQCSLWRVCVGQETPGARHLFTANHHFVLCGRVGVNEEYGCVFARVFALVCCVCEGCPGR